MNLSEHFSLAECTRSETAIRMGREVEAPPAIVANLTSLCAGVLEPIRAHLGRHGHDRGIRITSGYRPLWLNDAVHGSRTSDHQFGLAADIEVDGMRPEQLATEILLILPTLPIKQLILEFPPGGWVHVSRNLAGEQPKREVITALRRSTGTHYLTGLVNNHGGKVA